MGSWRRSLSANVEHVGKDAGSPSTPWPRARFQGQRRQEGSDWQSHRPLHREGQKQGRQPLALPMGPRRHCIFPNDISMAEGRKGACGKINQAPKEHQISVTITKRLHMLDDLLDGETVDPVKPDWMTDCSSSDSSSSGSSSPDSSSPDQDTKMSSHPPHFPLPTSFKGNCDNTLQSPSTHTNLVAAHQACNHFPNAITPNVSPHLVCTACHENPSLQRLTQRERDHMIRDKGIFPLCSSCTDVWCEHHHVGPEEVIDNCTCEIQFPQWLCTDCWIEVAKVRTHRADACSECSEVRTEREVKGEDVISEGVNMCSGCLSLVVKGGSEDGSSVSADDEA
jgi:hypothetical protein